MKSLQGVSFIFYCLFSSVILKALPHLMMEEKSSSEGGSRNSSQENLNDATWRDLSSAEASRVGSPVTAAGHDERGHKIEAIVENHAGVQPPEQLREAVESYAASLQTKQIEPAMEVLPAHSLEKEIAEAKNLATTLRQQLILKSYELTLPLPPQKAGASFLESVRQAIVPKSGQALVEESMAVIIADVTERSKARCPDNRFAQKRMTDLEKAIEQSERAVQIRDQVSEVSRPQFETQMEVRRARLAGMNQDVQETIRNLKIENDPSLAALAMKEVLKEKVEELRLDNSLFRGESNEIPTTENFIQISTLYHLTEQTLFMAEDVFAATAADALQSPESNETLNKRCDQAAALVVSLRAILLATKESVEQMQFIDRNFQSYFLSLSAVGSHVVENSVEAMRRRVVAASNLSSAVRFVEEEISNTLSLAQNIFETLPKETSLSVTPLTNDQFAALCNTVKQASLARSQTSAVRYYNSFSNADELAYPHLCKEFCRSNLEQIKNQSARRALDSQLELQFLGPQFNAELIPTAERVADIQEMARLAEAGVDNWKQSSNPIVATAFSTNSGGEMHMRYQKKR